MSFSHKYAKIEHQRKFLLNALPFDFELNGPYKIFEDTHFPKTRLKIRKVTDNLGNHIDTKLVQKYQNSNQPKNTSTNTSIYLDHAEYSLLSNLSGLTIIKKRYSYIHKGIGFGIEIFIGELEGLLLAEIEAGFEAIQAIQMPDFVIKDVTEDPFFSGVNLSVINTEKLGAKLSSIGIQN